MTGCPEGYNPVAGLFLEEGNFYGTTFNGGGSLSLGVVFKITTDGSNYTVLHTFMGGTSDGGNPTPVFPPMLPATSMTRPTAAAQMVAAPCSRSPRMGALMPFCTTSAA